MVTQRLTGFYYFWSPSQSEMCLDFSLLLIKLRQSIHGSHCQHSYLFLRLLRAEVSVTVIFWYIEQYGQVLGEHVAEKGTVVGMGRE